MTVPRPSQILLAALALALAAQAFAAESILTGSKDALWLISPKDGGWQILLKPQDKSWSLLTRDISASPVAAAAIDTYLHVGFKEGGYLIYSPTDSKGSAQISLSGTPLAFCEAGDLSGGPPTILAIAVAKEGMTMPASVTAEAPSATMPVRPAGGPTSALGAASTRMATFRASSGATVVKLAPTASAPASRPASAPTTSAATHSAATQPSATTVATTSPVERQISSQPAQATNLGVFRYSGGDWHMIALWRGVRLAADSRILAAVLGDTLYVLIASPERNQLAAFTDGRWIALPLEEPLASARPVGLLTVQGRLLLVSDRAGGGEHRLSIAKWDATRESFSVQPIVHDGKSIQGDNPLVGRLGERLMIVWQDKAALKYANCDLNGEMEAPSEVSYTVYDNRGGQITQWFIWGVLIAMFLAVILMRPKAATKPFSLPQDVVLGSLFKRLLAGLFDLAPFMMIATAIFQVPSASSEDFMAMARQEKPVPESAAYAMIAGLMAFVVYCSIMEHRFGATVGKFLFRLRVVGDEAKPPAARDVIIRNLMKIVEIVTIFPFPLLLLLPIFNRNRQRLGDMLARTAVIEVRATIQPPASPPPHEPDERQDKDGPGQPT